MDCCIERLPKWCPFQDIAFKVAYFLCGSRVACATSCAAFTVTVGVVAAEIAAIICYIAVVINCWFCWSICWVLLSLYSSFCFSMSAAFCISSSFLIVPILSASFSELFLQHKLPLRHLCNIHFLPRIFLGSIHCILKTFETFLQILFQVVQFIWRF